jgi:glycosyltransferase involved in cell wall biosynthesis
VRVAILTTHPIQYYAPWFRWIANHSSLDLKVFYLWDTEKQSKHDPGFGREIKWDLPLLEGYDSEFVPNFSAKPGTERFFGFRNPGTLKSLRSWKPNAALLIGYRYESLLRLILTPESRRGFPLIFRGDSHRLVRKGRGLKTGIRRRAIARIYCRFAAVTFVGRANKQYFRMHGVPEEKLFFAPHAVDNQRFFAAEPTARKEAILWRRELGIPQDHLLVLFAGKLEEKKRPLDLLEAFRQLRRDDVSLLFVGNGEQEAQLRERASSLPNVHFALFQNQSQMPRAYAVGDLFVLPSYGPEESWGLAINEALCLAKPVIVSSHVGCAADLVRPGESGLVFEAGNVAALTAALRDALSDRNRLSRWGAEGRTIVEEYDYSHATAGLMNGLEFVMANEGKAPVV